MVGAFLSVKTVEYKQNDTFVHRLSNLIFCNSWFVNPVMFKFQRNLYFPQVTWRRQAEFDDFNW